MQKFFYVQIILFPLFVLLIIITSTSASTITSSGCFIKLNESLLMVVDVWSKKYSLPGGNLLVNETPKQGAIRETFEETGLAVNVCTPLSRLRTLRIFSCEVAEHVNLIKNHYPQKDYIFGALSMPDSSRNEIRKAVLVDPFTLPKKLWRFPSQRELILDLFEKTRSQSSVTFITNELEDIHGIFKQEIEWIKYLQSFDNSVFVFINRYLTKLGEFYFIIIILPFFLFSNRWRKGILLLIAVFVSSLVNSMLKDLFALGRPFEWVSEIQRTNAYYFGFPSGHAQTATVFWGLLFLVFNMKFSRLLCVIAIASVAFTRVYLGVHFPHDVIGGIFIGVLIVLGFSGFIRKDNIDGFLLNIRMGWLCWVIFSFLGLFFRFHPFTLFISTLWLGVMVGLQFGAKVRYQFDLSMIWYIELFRVVMGIIGIITIVLLFNKFFPCNNGFLLIAMRISASFFLVGIWISWGSFVFFNYLENLKRLKMI